DLAKEVTCRQSYDWTETVWRRETGYGRQDAPRFHVVAVDYGAKRNILRMLAEHGCRVTVVPATASTQDILRHEPDGIFLSNGPGDPAATGEYAVPVLRDLIGTGKPIFGICLGHQMLALALGGKTRKMDKGHRGANHPVQDPTTGKVEIASQNPISGGLRFAPPARHRIRPVPKRTDIQSILIIGAGPIVIGQACEFDYSGAQACKALKAEGYRIVLVNSNPATIMTDPDLADATYIEPITPDIVEQIIARERPDALLPTMGGQTALNTAMALARSGVLKRYGVKLIGASEEAIAKAEDRQLFRLAMDRIGLESPKSRLVGSLDAAIEALEAIGLPAIIRPSFTLGGTGGGI